MQLPKPGTPCLAVDTECTGLDPYNPLPTYDNPEVFFEHPARPYMVTACNHEGRTWCWRWHVDPVTRQVHWNRNDVNEIGLLLDNYPLLVFHNARYDMRMLLTIGLDLAPRFADIHDTLASAHVLDSAEPHGLKPLAAKYLGILSTDEDILLREVREARAEAKRRGLPRGPDVSCDYFLPYELLQSASDQTYGTQDAVRCQLLFQLHLRELPKQKLTRFYLRELEVMEVTYRMENHGVRVRPRSLPVTLAKHRQLRDVFRLQATRIASKYGHPVINLNSQPQLVRLLYGEDSFALPVVYKTDKGSPSIDKTALAACEGITDDIANTKRMRAAWKNLGYTPKTLREWQDISDFIHALLDYRAHNTACSYLTGYLRSVPATQGLIHSVFNPWGTSTTRYSSSEPNLQNVGKRARVPLRKVFGPPPDYVWYCCDYNQLELRIMAKASGDATLIRILAEGQDQHQITADALNVSRPMGKNINYAWQYGAGDNKLSLMAGMDATDFNARMRQTYPGVVDFGEQTQALIRQRHAQEGFGYVLTLFGYRLMVSINAPYKGIDYVIQGTAGDILKLAMIETHNHIRLSEYADRAALVLSIHDELVFEAHKSVSRSFIADLAEIMASMGEIVGCPTPVDVTSTTTHWANCKSCKLPLSDTKKLWLPPIATSAV